jgi:hypothetical protein
MKQELYEAQGDKIYVRINDKLELFIQIYPTSDCTKTPEEQAIILTEVINSL